MIFWPHEGDLSKPPELEDLRWRRPSVDYWESPASNKETALASFWIKWKRETGKEYPRKPPHAPARPPGFAGNSVSGSRRPDHQSEKRVQDASGG